MVFVEGLRQTGRTARLRLLAGRADRLPRRSRQGKRHTQSLVERAETRRRETGDVVRQQRFGQADQRIAVNARLVFQTLVRAHVDLCGESVTASVDRRADDRREGRVDQRLSTDDDEDAGRSGVVATRPTHPEEIAAPQGST